MVSGLTDFYSKMLTSIHFQVTTFADRPGYQRVSSTLWKQREDYCASLIQKAWKCHKERNTESHTEPVTADEDDLETSHSQLSSAPPPGPSMPTVAGGGKTVTLPPLPGSKSSGSVASRTDSKHLIEVKSADEEKQKKK